MRQYLEAATPEPAAKAASSSHLPTEVTQYVEWKRRLASQRRANFRESLVELHERKRRADEASARRRTQRRAERDRRVHQEKREDERLTSPTLVAAMKQLQLGPTPDPDRSSRVAEMASRVKAQQVRREEQRSDTLHTLYMHARDFITTEKQLNEEIERVFKPIATEWAGDVAGENIWNTGPPETVQEMLNTLNKMDDKAIRRHEGYARLSQERVQRVAEELTGGKM